MKNQILAIGSRLLLVSTLFLSCETVFEKKHEPTHELPILEELLAGNQRFVTGQSLHPHQSHARILETETAQHPRAVVVACSDSRVSPEILFDAGIGDLFVIRTAGNLLDDIELGSIEYAVEHLRTPLVVVLGHTECGAVKAFVEGGEAPGHIRNLVESIAHEPEEQAAIRQSGKNLGNCIEANILHGVQQIRQDEPVLSNGINQQKLQVIPMIYDVHTGIATVLSETDLRQKCQLTH